MDMFDLIRQKNMKDRKPLADRMKPVHLDDVLGQDHLIGPGKLLRRSLEADRIQSMILHGPAGVGKTSLAKLVSLLTSSRFVTLNAVTSGVKDIKQVIEEAHRGLEFEQERTILFIDEIHRFNKLQQDALLPFVEDGTVILIGATTENPYFEVNQALISRSLVFELHPLGEEDIIRIIDRALQTDTVLQSMPVEVTNEAKRFLAQKSSGDARLALNALELGVLTTEPVEGKIIIGPEVVAECIQKRFMRYDKTGDNHYDVISAFIKSMRGSDPDATLHYLARMILAGEDPQFIARRIIIAASEDVGLAHSRALGIAVDAMQAVKFVGFPEARIILAHAALFVALSPKSNTAYMGINAAMRDVERMAAEVPTHLRDATNKKMKKLEGQYRYPHDSESGYVQQQYLPDELMDQQYYLPKWIGEEKRLNEFIEKVKDYERKEKV